MSTASVINSIEEHIQDAYDTLEIGGADLTNVNKNIENISAELKDRLLDYMNNGTEQVWNNWEKVSASNVAEATLNNTVQAPMKIDVKGDTKQKQLSGKNLFNFNGITIYNYHVTSSKANNQITITCTDNRSPYCRLRPNITLKPNTTYTVSIKYTGTLKKIKMFTNDYTTWGEESTTGTLTFTTTSEVYELSLGIYPKDEVGASITVYDIQLEEGSTATDYEPYCGRSSKSKSRLSTGD